MKLWSGVVTGKVAECGAFYRDVFGCEIVFEADWFVLLSLGGAEIGFLKPGLESQAEAFRRPWAGDGVWITVDMADAPAEEARLRALGVPIEHALRTEPWGDRHFVVRDPAGVPVDVVQRVTDG